MAKKATMSLSARAREAGIPVATVYARKKAGWTEKEALSIPVGERRPSKKKAAAKKKRSHDSKGQFVADDPNTPEDEAWITISTIDNDSAVPEFTPAGTMGSVKKDEVLGFGAGIAAAVIFIAIAAILFMVTGNA